MKRLRGFFYGHYDSRGGSAFMVATTKRKADRLYAKELFCLEGEELRTARGLCKEDFISRGVIYIPDDIKITDGLDLENMSGYCVVLQDLSKAERVVPPLSAEGLYQFSEADEADGAAGNFPQGGTTMMVAELVKCGTVPEVVKKWYHPRWDDDAFGLVVMFEDIGGLAVESADPSASKEVLEAVVGRYGE